MLKFFDVQHPFFTPLWRRIVIVVACLGWAGVEASNAAWVWAAIFGAAGVYCAYQFFVVFDPQDPPEDP